MTMDKNKQKKEGKTEEDPTKKYEEEYPENGDNFSAGKADSDPLPNKPAENEEKKAPEEEEEDKQ